MAHGRNLAMWKRDVLPMYRKIREHCGSYGATVRLLSRHYTVSEDAVCKAIEIAEIAESARIPRLKRRQKQFAKWKEQHSITRRIYNETV